MENKLPKLGTIPNQLREKLQWEATNLDGKEPREGSDMLKVTQQPWHEYRRALAQRLLRLSGGNQEMQVWGSFMAGGDRAGGPQLKGWRVKAVAELWSRSVGCGDGLPSRTWHDKDRREVGRDGHSGAMCTVPS